jgi:nucleoside-diphosphate-sugar epimerase
MSVVLVTGGSGFIGSHCIVRLLAAGHAVRTTVRNLAREGDVRAMLKNAGIDPGNRLAFFAAELEHDAGWREAASGCEFVLHVASPIPPALPRHEDELIVPARDGALRVLKASRNAGVKRVVMTSSGAAVAYGHKMRKAPFTEADWTNLEGRHVAPYPKSKTIAERAAWDFVATEGGGIEFSVINPVAVLGPTLGADLSSLLILQRLLDGTVPGCPKLYFALVDVRDVADLHLRAMIHPAAKGERFIAAAGDTVSFLDIAKVLKTRLGAAAKRVPTRELPNWIVRIVALRDPAVRTLTSELGIIRRMSNEKARRLLGWTPRSNEEAILAGAESLIDLGLTKDSRKKAP